MEREGPPLETLLRRLLETPAEFLAEPRIGRRGEIDVGAVLWDTFRELGAAPLAEEDLSLFRPSGRGATKQRNRLRVSLITCWLLHESWFRGQSELAESTWQFFEESLPVLEQYLDADRLLNDPDRREELIRRLLCDVGLRPAGESPTQAADRLQTLNSAERQRVLREAAKAERRAQQIREAMARKAAQDAASRYGE